MPARGKLIREELKAVIEAKKEASGFNATNDFTVDETYFPHKGVDELQTAHVWVIYSGSDEERQTRNLDYPRTTVPVQISLQRQVDPSDIDAVDILAELLDELQEEARRLEFDNTSWIRTEQLKDENGLPYNFVKFREQGVFEAIFTVFYLWTGK